MIGLQLFHNKRINKMKKFIYFLILSIPALVLADLPTAEQQEQLYLKKCGINGIQWLSRKGGFKTKPLFAIKGEPISMTVNKLDGDIVIDFDLKKTLKSLLCWLTDCEYKTTNYFFSGEESFMNQVYLLWDNQLPNRVYSLTHTGTKSRKVNQTFNTRGVSYAMVHRYDEQVYKTKNDAYDEESYTVVNGPDITLGFLPNNDIYYDPNVTTTWGDQWNSVGTNESVGLSCDTNFVYVQNKPTVGTTISQTIEPGRVSGMIYFSGLQDQYYSKNAVNNLPVQYVVQRKVMAAWTGKFCDVVEEYNNWETIRHLSPSSSLSFSNIDCHVGYRVRAFDGKFYSSWSFVSAEHNPRGDTGTGGGTGTSGGNTGTGGTCGPRYCEDER